MHVVIVTGAVAIAEFASTTDGSAGATVTGNMASLQKSGDFGWAVITLQYSFTDSLAIRLIAIYLESAILELGRSFVFVKTQSIFPV
nr:hypothetical protein [Xanthomonas euvesicatoria]